MPGFIFTDPYTQAYKYGKNKLIFPYIANSANIISSQNKM